MDLIYIQVRHLSRLWDFLWVTKMSFSVSSKSVCLSGRCCLPVNPWTKRRPQRRHAERASARLHGLLARAVACLPTGEFYPTRGAHVDRRSVRDAAGDEGGQQRRTPLPCSRARKMRGFALSLVSSGGFLKGTVTVSTEDMSTTASPTIPSSQLTSEQLTVVAASCKWNIQTDKSIKKKEDSAWCPLKCVFLITRFSRSLLVCLLSCICT